MESGMARIALVAVLIFCSVPVCPAIATVGRAARPALSSPLDVLEEPGGAGAGGLPGMQATLSSAGLRYVKDVLVQQVRRPVCLETVSRAKRPKMDRNLRSGAGLCEESEGKSNEDREEDGARRGGARCKESVILQGGRAG
jgi:hypothetical protein